MSSLLGAGYVTCEWCGHKVHVNEAVDYKPINHPLTVCPNCLPRGQPPDGETYEV